MRFFRRSLPAVVIASTLLAAPGQADEADRVAELRQRALADDRPVELVRSLTSEVGPRFAGTEGYQRAVKWAVARLERMGFDRVWTEDVPVPRWVRGEAEGRIVAPGPQGLFLTALGGSVGTPEEGIEAEVVRVPDFAALGDLTPEQVTGKIVFFDAQMERQADGSGYRPVVVQRAYGAWRASEMGAVAVVIRSVATGPDRFPHTGGMKSYEGRHAPIPAFALAVPDADILAHQVSLGEPVRLYLRSTSHVLPDGTDANVLAELRGSVRPEEIVLLAAHLDSWDNTPGANDDAAGCAIVMGAARLLAELPERPRRTVRVFLAANEEFGISGGKAYALAHGEEPHYLGIEADSGGGRVVSFESRFGPDGDELRHALLAALQPDEVEDLGNGARGGADLVHMMVGTGLPVIDLEQDNTYYFDVHHSANDTFSRIVPEDLRQAVAAFATSAYLAAQSEAELRPAPTSARPPASWQPAFMTEE